MKTYTALLAICAGNSPVTGEFPVQRAVTQSFDVFLDPWLNKRLSKQLRGCWFETPLRSLWRHGNVVIATQDFMLLAATIIRPHVFGSASSSLIRLFIKIKFLWFIRTFISLRASFSTHKEVYYASFCSFSSMINLIFTSTFRYFNSCIASVGNIHSISCLYLMFVTRLVISYFFHQSGILSFY